MRNINQQPNLRRFKFLREKWEKDTLRKKIEDKLRISDFFVKIIIHLEQFYLNKTNFIFWE